jgi:hypothetical protein
MFIWIFSKQQFCGLCIEFFNIERNLVQHFYIIQKNFYLIFGQFKLEIIFMS